MNPSFMFVNHGGVALVVFRKWWEEGILHGMTTRTLSFRDGTSASTLCAAIGVSRLAVPSQSHGNVCVDLREQQRAEMLRSTEGGDFFRIGEGDAVLVPSGVSVPLAFGVLSADCVPVVVRAKASWALIHAGWRGLANGVIERAVGLLQEPLEAAVFPSAGGGAYEVGAEVIEAIGASAVFSRSPEGLGRLLLNTAATAIKQLRLLAPEVEAVSSDICTISDSQFHSFRRDGDRAGRAVTFLKLP